MVFFSRLEISTIGYTCMRYQNKAIRNYENEHQSGSICIHDWRRSGPLPDLIKS